MFSLFAAKCVSCVSNIRGNEISKHFVFPFAINQRTQYIHPIVEERALQLDIRFNSTHLLTLINAFAKLCNYSERMTSENVSSSQSRIKKKKNVSWSARLCGIRFLFFRIIIASFANAFYHHHHHHHCSTGSNQEHLLTCTDPTFRVRRTILSFIIQLVNERSTSCS